MTGLFLHPVFELHREDVLSVSDKDVQLRKDMKNKLEAVY